MAESAVETTYTVEYQGAMALSLQQTVSKLAMYAQTSNHVGPKAELEDQFGAAQAQEADTRHGPTKSSDVAINRRWLAKPKERYFNKYLDNDDEMSSKVDIKGAYTKLGTATVNRVKDEAFLLGFYGSNLTGEDGSTSTPFASGNVSAVNYASAGTGLTVEKIMWGREKLTANLADLEVEKPVVLVTAKQITDLLKQVQVTSRDYNPLQQLALQTGTVQEILGCIFVSIEYGNAVSFPKLIGSGGAGSATDQTVDGSGNRRVPMFVPSGMHIGTWQDMRAFVNTRPDLQYCWQVFCGRTVAACRMMEEKNIQLLCTET